MKIEHCNNPHKNLALYQTFVQGTLWHKFLIVVFMISVCEERNVYFWIKNYERLFLEKPPCFFGFFGFFGFSILQMLHGSDLKSNHITWFVLSCSENRRSFAHPSIKRIIAWNGHNMGLFLDQSIETSHGKIHHMERTQKRVWEKRAGKENPYFGR